MSVTLAAPRTPSYKRVHHRTRLHTKSVMCFIYFNVHRCSELSSARLQNERCVCVCVSVCVCVCHVFIDLHAVGFVCAFVCTSVCARVLVWVS